MTEELKPCPFKHKTDEVVLTILDGCGSYVGEYKKGESLYGGERISAVCQLCHARGPIAYKAKEAIELWNRRATNE